MIETIENSLQIAVLLVCTGFAAARAVTRRSRADTFLALLYCSWALGDLYWMTCLAFFGRTPQVPLVSDLSWYASYLFLYMLLRQVSPADENTKSGLLPWLGYVFTGVMAVFYMTWGKILGNLIYAGLMGLLLFASIRRLTGGKGSRSRSCLPMAVILFCLLEYGLWTVSCFWEGSTLANPYYWFDILLTLCFPAFLLIVEKEARA